MTAQARTAQPADWMDDTADAATRVGAESDPLDLAGVEDAANFLKALAHPVRLRILCWLAERERSVGELEQLLAERQPAVSQQLGRLREDQLVNARRDGKQIYYSLSDPQIAALVRILLERFR